MEMVVKYFRSLCVCVGGVPRNNEFTMAKSSSEKRHGDGFLAGLACRLGHLFFNTCQINGAHRRSYFESLRTRRLSVRKSNVRNAIKMEIQDRQKQFGGLCTEKREITQVLLRGTEMRKDGNFNLPQALGGFRKESIYDRRNVGAISAQLHSAQENAANQVTKSQLMDFTYAQFKNLHDQNEVGHTNTHLLEQTLVALSKVMGK